MFRATGKKQFKFEEIIQGVIKLGVDCDDWVDVLEKFINDGHIIRKDKIYTMGELFDYLEYKNPQLELLKSAVKVIIKIGEDTVPEDIRITMDLPEQVAWIQKTLKELA